MPISALIVRVPEAELAVSALRATFDPSAAKGVPAHVTILVPFVEPDSIRSEVEATLAHLFSRHRSFKFSLGRIGRFPATTYLAPEPAEPFITLTREVAQLFPEHPPYAGAYTEIVPHLTVADGSVPGAEHVEQQLRIVLAKSQTIQCTCTEVVLIENSSGEWKVRSVFMLAAGDA
jgi:hypothetical protein